jgi:hypothetical protein
MLNNEEVGVINNSTGTIELGGDTFVVAQPLRSDLFSFWKHCRKLAQNSFDLKSEIEGVKTLDVSENIKTNLIAAVILQSKNEPSQLQLWEAMNSCEGVAYLTFLLTRKHNKVKLENIKKLINEDNIDETLINLEDACGMRVITEHIKTDPLLRTTK